MNEIEKKALALLQECGFGAAHIRRGWNVRYEALCRAIEAHEAFRQEVSDAVEKHWGDMPCEFDRFVIAKPDPLVEVVKGVTWYDNEITANELRAALAARGLEIREVDK